MTSRYISIDLETTGLDPETCQILEIGAVIETIGSNVSVDELPTFHCFIDNGTIVGEPYALQMNQKILKSIAEGKGIKSEYAVDEFLRWLDDNNLCNYNLCNYNYEFKTHLTFAGKNVASFDLQFLKKLPGWDQVKVRHRTIDPGILYWNPMVDGSEIPATSECLRRAGKIDIIKHNAVDDARQVIELIRCYFF